MKSSCRPANFRIAKPVISVLVIAALCFSVGEGLRLTPFTSSHLIGVEVTDTPLTKTSDKISNHRYGPLYVPPHNQKRSKRDAVPLDVLLTANSYAIPSALRFSTSRESFDIISILVVSQSASRAPPFAS